jgi:hypothetical protein
MSSTQYSTPPVPAHESRRMQSSLSNNRNLSISTVNGHDKDSGKLMFPNTTDDSDDSFYLECGDYVYNISNLVLEQKLKAKAPIAPVYISKKREGRIYPSRHHVESIGDVDIDMLFAIVARPVQSAENVVGFNNGRGPSATKCRDSTSRYSANSGRRICPSSNGIVGSRSVVLMNNKDEDIDRISYGIVSSRSIYHRHLQSEIAPSSHIDGRSDRNQQYSIPCLSPKKDPNLPADGQIEVEISPGVFALLRGSEETWRAIQAGHFETVVCVCCCNTLQCIADAEYVLCPECRVVSPVLNQYRERSASGQRIRGVGLGLLAPAA